MATKIRKKTSEKQVVRFKRKKRIRAKVSGTIERPRLSVFRSNTTLYVQLIDDIKGHTLLAGSTKMQDFAKDQTNLQAAKLLGEWIATKAKEKKISKVVFDRGGYLYHGRVKALADSARESGLEF